MKKSPLIGAGLIALACLACSAPSFAAATDNVLTQNVVIPTGDWLQALAGVLNTFVPLIFTAIFGFLGKTWLGTKLSAENRAAVEQLAQKAISYAVNKAILAAPSSVTLPVHNDVLAIALQYAITHAPDIVKWAGGAAMFEQKLLARLDLQPPQAADIAAPAVAATPAVATAAAAAPAQ